MEAASQQFLDSSRFWIQRVFVPIMVFIGIGGNIVTVMVLTRKRMRCSTNIYLTALAVADIIYLFFVLVLSFKHYNNIHDRKYELYWRFYGLIHWLCDAASSSSVWLTVSFTVERYIAVCHPIKGKVLCTENRAKSIIVLVTILCILTTASTTFEYQLSLSEECNKDCDVNELKKLQQTSGKNLHHNSTTIHYLPNHTILLNQQNNNGHSDLSNIKFLNDVYTSLKPNINNILIPINCTSHPHIIYMPIYTSIINKTNHNSENNNLIDNEMGNNKNQTLTNDEENVNLERPPNFEDETNNETSIEKLSELKDNNNSKNATCCIKYRIDTEYTTLGNDETYKKIIYWYSAIGFGLLPLILIASFNCFLVHAVYKSQKRRRKMTNTQENHSMSNENRITIMLIGVVILFLICQTPTASLLIYENFYVSPDKISTNILLRNIFNFLVTVNAACNFLLYCVLSKKYRTTFKKLFCERKKNKQDVLILTSTNRSRNSQRFNPKIHGLRRNVSEYHTPRNLETNSLTSIPRSKSLITREPGKAKSTDLIT